MHTDNVGRQATPLDGESTAGRFSRSKNAQGIFITRRHWEKDNRIRPAKSFNKIGSADLVEVGPASDEKREKKSNSPLVYGPYQKRNNRRNKKKNKNHRLMMSVKPYMTSIYSMSEKPRRPEKRFETPRGKITSFSRKSRARLMRKIFSLITLPEIFSSFTYDDTVIEELLNRPENKDRPSGDVLNEKIHADIHKMSAFLRKKYPEVWFYWRVDWVPRKYGKLQGLIVPHWHGLWGGPIPFEILKTIVLKKWLEYTGTQNPDAHAVTYREKSFIKLDGKRNILFYVSKYTAKESGRIGFKTGRHWGAVGPIPIAKGVTIEVDSWEAPHLVRLLKRWLKSRTNKGGKTNYLKKTLFKGLNAYIYIEDFNLGVLLEFAAELGEIPF